MKPELRLSRQALQHIPPQDHLELPEPALFELPEKVLQFGTGVLLRALPDYLIDKANKRGVFHGRVVMVKSTSGDVSAYERQDGLYTVCVRGLESGQIIEQNIVNASISRVLAARTQWQEVVQCAADPQIKVVISNTTETGIQKIFEALGPEMPESFPGKLLVFLYERFKRFKGDENSGLVIVPTELIPHNGDVLRNIVCELATEHGLGPSFQEWLQEHNTFCNSLVDRIVPGKPAGTIVEELENQLGYQDECLTMAESFNLWAIEGNEKVRETLSFASVNEGMVITDDISHFSELKLRLLNGSHSFSCGAAFLSGFTITRDAVNDPVFGRFIHKMMQDEIVPAIPYPIDHQMKVDFAAKVLDRFRNPYIDHKWLSISLQYTSKMKMRNVPLLLRYFTLFGKVPPCMATAFASYLYFMKAVDHRDGKYFGQYRGEAYEIRDDAASFFYDRWQNYGPARLVEQVLSQTSLWGADLAALPGFTQTVSEKLNRMMAHGVYAAIESV